MKTKIYIICIIALIAIINKIKAQDAHFSQFFATPSLLAPSLAGSTDGGRVNTAMRGQWTSIGEGYKTYLFGIDHYFPAFKSGLGLNVMRDVAGSGKLGLTSLILQYAYILPINENWTFRPGISMAYSQRSLNYNNLVFGDQLNFIENAPTSIESEIFNKANYTDFSTSIMFHNQKMWFGFLLDHLTQPNQSLRNSESIVPIKYQFFTGYKHILRGKEKYGNEESISFTSIYRKQANFSQIDFGGYWTKIPIVMGVFYRGMPQKMRPIGNWNQDAICFIAGYKIVDLSITYSYDIGISNLRSKSGGAHEINIILEFNQDQKIRRKKRHIFVPCPKI